MHFDTLGLIRMTSVMYHRHVIDISAIPFVTQVGGQSWTIHYNICSTGVRGIVSKNMSHRWLGIGLCFTPHTFGHVPSSHVTGGRNRPMLHPTHLAMYQAHMSQVAGNRPMLHPTYIWSCTKLTCHRWQE